MWLNFNRIICKTNYISSLLIFEWNEAIVHQFAKLQLLFTSFFTFQWISATTCCPGFIWKEDGSRSLNWARSLENRLKFLSPIRWSEFRNLRRCELHLFLEQFVMSCFDCSLAVMRPSADLAFSQEVTSRKF